MLVPAYLIIEIRPNILIQYHGDYIEVEKLICLKLAF